MLYFLLKKLTKNFFLNCIILALLRLIEVANIEILGIQV